jgi:acyl carrier protein
MSDVDIAGRVRRYIVENFYVADAAALEDHGSLLDQGIIDSTGVLELIGFIEREFGVKVEDDEMVPENLDSIAQVAAYVSRKKAAAA